MYTPIATLNADTKLSEQAHQLLNEILDDVTEQSKDWEAKFDELKSMVRPITTGVKRWKNPEATTYESLLHYNLDLAFRQNKTGIEQKLTNIRAWLVNKFDNQVEFADKVNDLRIAARQLAKQHGSLDPDTEDPIGVLRDALLSYDPKMAKVIMRELTRKDKYSYQRVVTNTNHIICQLDSYINSPRFEMWPLDTDAATCGAVSNHYKDTGWWKE
jgi:hypothetical protein